MNTKWYIRAILLSVFIAGTGCLQQSYAQAKVSRFIWTLHETHAVENPCTGEIVDLTVNMTLEGHKVILKNGILASIKQEHVWEGIGRISGTRYHGRYYGTDHKLEIINGASINRSLFNIVLVSNGSDDNWHLKFLTHKTVNANNELTATMSFDESECK